jgi:pimeloyl-ACP methyl ester carboxylesterase
MDVVLGRLRAQLERPQTLKFKWPVVAVPEFFATRRHLEFVVGYLASLGWETYAIDLRNMADDPGSASRGQLHFADMVRILADALASLDGDAIILGHGIGGLLALKMAELPRVKAAVAFAPQVPGFRSPLFMRAGNLVALWRGRPCKPPSGKKLLELIADADIFQREAIINALVPSDATAALEVMRGEIEFTRAPCSPRLIVVGDCDIFAPHDRVTQFAEAIDARVATLNGRGHWLIGGRALERAVAEAQRFLVRALGQDLLLLYPDELRENGDRDGGGDEDGA